VQPGCALKRPQGRAPVVLVNSTSEFGLNKPAASAKAGVPKCFRRLKWNEVVSRGDFVADEHQRLEPWEGPGGFRANAFLKPIYRRHEISSTATKKTR